MSSFMNTKRDNADEVQDFILRKIQDSARLKELEVPIVDEFIVHQILNQLPTSFHQHEVTYNYRMIKEIEIR